jgi:preprotein translocase subunit SecE
MAKKSGKSSKAAAAAQQTEGLGGKLAQLKEFFEESKVEIKKVTWPSRKETMVTGIAVLVLVVVMSVYLGVVDFALSKAVALILS